MTTCEIASLYCEDFDEVTRATQLSNNAYSAISVSEKPPTQFLCKNKTYSIENDSLVGIGGMGCVR